MNKQLLKGHSELLILAALAREPMHGYALSERLRDELHDLFKFGVGMLYPLLHGMEKKKLIKGEWQAVEGADRRVYSLTKNGRKSLAAQKKEWQTFSSLVNSFVQVSI